MKRLFPWLFGVLLSLALFLGAFSVTRAAEPFVVKVGGYNNPPKIYKDLNDVPAGVFVDIVNYIAAKENWKIEYVFGSWEASLKRLENGQIDIMPDVAITSERREKYDFSKETVLVSRAIVYVKKDSGISTVRDLEGKKIAVQNSSIYFGGSEGIVEYLDSYHVKAEIVGVVNYESALGYLEIGKVDAAVVSYIYGLANEKNYRNIEQTQIYLKPAELRFALTKGAPDNAYLIEKLDYWVGKLKSGEDNYLNESLERNGLSDIEKKMNIQGPVFAKSLLWWLLPAAGGILLVASVFLLFHARRFKRARKV